MHGTMLPSFLPLGEIPAAVSGIGGDKPGGYAGPIRVSRGNHPSVRKKDKQRAELYQQGRAQRLEISQYWN